MFLYGQFLERCHPQIDEDKAFEPGWEYKVVHKAYEAMLNTDLALKQIIQVSHTHTHTHTNTHTCLALKQIIQVERERRVGAGC